MKLPLKVLIHPCLLLFSVQSIHHYTQPGLDRSVKLEEVVVVEVMIERSWQVASHL